MASRRCFACWPWMIAAEQSPTPGFFAETNLHQQIMEGNTTATIFLLKTRGRKRGYIERQNIQVDADISTTKLSPEAQKKIDEILNGEY